MRVRVAPFMIVAMPVTMPHRMTLLTKAQPVQHRTQHVSLLMVSVGQR